ncbi:MAG: glycine--tRNA ligase [Gemmatimonadetes bacterium]|nr:glycine--tRNA ligase [Gemmatimonadota bacterium]
MSKNQNDRMEKIVSLCKRRGFVFQSSEIYGGINGCYDYGPLGAELKRNVKEFWWSWMTRRRDDIEALDASILMHSRVWEASGHVGGFVDPMVDCRTCKGRFRADQLDESRCLKKPSKTPAECGGDLTEAREFNLMFKTSLGPVDDGSSAVFLRPETAQGIYVNFHNVAQSARRRIPFGIAQIGKAFRNEINPRNFTFRTREFEQMEMQYFVRPSTDEQWFETWKSDRMDYYREIGLDAESLRYVEHGPGELAHYARAAFDIEYLFPFGWKELEGIHNRGDFDLTRHQEYSGKPQTYFDEETKERYLPVVVEASAGCDRTLLSLLCDAYDEEEAKGGNTRVVMRLHPKLAPVKAGIFPLVKRDGMPERARAIYDDLRTRFRVLYEQSGSIGKRYWRQDEAGTPYCFTVDSETMADGSVTVRHRDAMSQERIPAEKIAEFLDEKTRIS